MKLKDLEFKRVGCCGEYLNATADLGDGRAVLATDHEDGTYTLALTQSGVLVGGIVRNITADVVDKVLG